MGRAVRKSARGVWPGVWTAIERSDKNWLKPARSRYVAFLTDRTVYDFYRGQNGEYLHSQFSNDNAQHVWNGINEVANPSVDVIPDGDFQVLCYEMAINACSDTLANVRNLTTVGYTGEGHVGPSGRQRHVNIHGIYKPFTDCAHYFALQDGATIDLSERTTELDLTNKSFVFASDAEIRINLGNRRVPSTECLIKWDAKPENVKFLSMRNESGCFESRADGLYRFRGLTIYIR